MSGQSDDLDLYLVEQMRDPEFAKAYRSAVQRNWSGDPAMLAHLERVGALAEAEQVWDAIERGDPDAVGPVSSADEVIDRLKPGVTDDDLDVLGRFKRSAGVGDAVWDAELDCEVATTAHGYLLYLIYGEQEST